MKPTSLERLLNQRNLLLLQGPMGPFFARLAAVLRTRGQTVSKVNFNGGDEWFSCDELFVSADGQPTQGVHIAFQAPDRETVHRFYEAGLEAGGRDNGAPGARSYHPGYYAAFNLIESLGHDLQVGAD